MKKKYLHIPILQRAVFLPAVPLLLFGGYASANGSQPQKTPSAVVATQTRSVKTADAIKITGRVIDDQNLPLPGVNVTIKGTTTGTTTDADGKFTLMADVNTTLVFSFVGYNSKEVVVESGRTQYDVQLTPSATGLNEVVVVGYGTQKKVNLTGAVASISGEELKDKPVPNALAALQGVSPGVTITRSSGQPGSENYGIRIRGFSSANSADALVLVDGIEQDLGLINPEDIESISVLKDAAASAIYGARAAAGVVLVTTKKGAPGKPKITFNGYYGLNITARQPQRLNSWDEQTLIDEARFNATGAKEFTGEQVQWLENPNFDYRPNISGQDRWEYFDNTNWVKEGMNKYNSMKSYNMSASGGSADQNYLLSAGYYTRDGVLRYGPDDNSRYTFRFNFNSKLSKYVDMSTIMGYVGSVVNSNSYGTGGIINALYRIRTRQSLYTPAEDVTGQPYNGDLQINPIDIEKNAGRDQQQYDTFTGRFDLKIHDIVKGLRLDLSASRNQDYYSDENDRRSLYWYGRSTNTIRFSANVPNSVSKTKNKGHHDNLQAVLDYDLSIKHTHNFHFLLGTSFEQYRKDEITAGAQNLITNDFFSLNYADLATKTNGDNIETWALGSYFGRMTYNYKEKYLFEANARYDGSSRLAPGLRWQLFPSFSAGWRINEESFLKNRFSWLDNLKLRASWGQLGNSSALGLYDYIGLLNSGNSLDFNDTKTLYLYQNILPSSSLTWETVQTENVGLDIGVLNNRLSFTGDYYIKYNKNMLAQLQEPDIIGVGVNYANVGELKSWGWEIDLKWQDRFRNGGYNVGFNIANNQNKVTKYDGKSTIGTGGVVPILQGYPLNTVWGYKTAGYFQTQAEADAYKAKTKYGFSSITSAPGDIKYLDLNGDGIVNAGDGTPESPGDLVNLGTTNARYSYGVTLGANWKGFDFSVFFQGVFKRAFLITNDTLDPLVQTSNLPWSIHLDRWTPDNPNALFPRMYQKGTQNYQVSDKWTQDGSYIRLKNLQIGYTIPFNKKYIKNMRVYFSGQDLWESTKVLSVFDPEVPNNVSAGTYPFYRTVSFGVNATF
ncbi:MAG TPA: TonB-dependent receptor [Mucilaginibacter sp.]|nr:TonB-dependent receptor [Mucilaginibacter sp.]